MLTPSFQITATERVLPNLAIDFTSANLDARITFTRTTNATNPATYVNSSGFIVAATNNQPRFDYDPITKICRGLLIEESRTNRISYSEDFTQWTAAGVLVTSNQVAAPDNTTTADLVYGDGNTSAHTIRFFDTTSATGKTSSIFVKYKDCQYFQIWFDGDASLRANYDLINKTVTDTAGGVTASIVDFGDGWLRCICATSSTTATTTRYALISSATAGRSQSWATSTGVYLWGAQTEAGTFATSYIPTTTTALTRNADVAVMTGTNFSAWWNASEGAAVIQTIPRAASGTRPAIQFDDNTANEIITLRGSVADPQLYVVDGGAAQATLDAGTIAANTAYKLGGAWKASSFAASINGGAAVDQASGTLPAVTQTRLGSDGTNYLNGWLQNLRYWPQRIINTEVQAFSK